MSSQNPESNLTRDRVFLSYAHEDLETVRRVYEGLKKRKLNVWFDKEELGPGRWKARIKKAINRSKYFVICLSKAALRKTGDETPGFQDEELNTAYNIAEEQPDDAFSIVPVRLEDCARGDHRLTGFQQYDLFEDFDKGLDRLAVDLGGISLSDAKAHDERSEDEKMIERLWGKALTAYYAQEHEKAISFWGAVLGEKTENYAAWVNKGLSLGKLGRHDEAIAAYGEAIRLKPDSHQTWVTKGISLSKLGQHDEAIAAFNEAIRIKPDSHEAWNTKGICLATLGRYDEAIAAYDKALRIKPDYHAAWNNKGICLVKLGRDEEAIVDYDKAIRFKPDSYEAWNNKGIALVKLGRYEEAIATCNEAIRIKPDSHNPWLIKEASLRSLGRIKEAVAANIKAAEINPNFANKLPKVITKKEMK